MTPTIKATCLTLLIPLFLSCGPSSDTTEANIDKHQSDQIKEDTSIALEPIVDSIAAELDQPDTVDSAALLIETDLDQNPGLKRYLEYLHEAMEPVPNPVKAVFEGVDFGDYFHLSFRTSDNVYIDFADGNNNFGEYELFDPETYNDNEKYLGETFEIYWDYKKSTFLCCDGEMEGVVAKTPSIVSLKLIEN